MPTASIDAVPGSRAQGWLFQGRSEVLARHGIVATSDPLAAQAGLEILRRGGNAIDAAVATGAVLDVTSQNDTGIGGDLFAIVWSAALFGIAHMNLYQFATAFAIGIVAGWLYERCRSLWPCILLHAAYNGFVTFYNAWLFDQPQAERMRAGATGAAFAAAMIGGLMLLKLLHGGPRPNAGSERQET